jgi:hypothetical protein
MPYALVENNRVIDCVKVEPHTVFKKDYADKFIPAPEGVSVAWKHDGSNFIPPLEDPQYSYKTKRSTEYPNFIEYLDGVVKGDQAQIQAYIDACLAVKAKYPKPE